MNAEPPERIRPRAPRARSRTIDRLTSFGVLGLIAIPMIAFAQSQTARPESASISSTLVGIALLGMLLTIVLHALCVACETAFENLRAAHIRIVDNPKQRERLENYLLNRTDYLAGFSVGSAATNSLLSVLTVIPAFELAKQWPSLPAPVAVLFALFVLSIPVVGFNLVVGDLIPKTFATVHPGSVLRRLGPFVKGVGLLFSWQGHLLTQLASLITTRVGTKASFVRTALVEDEIKSMVTEAQAQGDIEVQEKDLLHSVFEFGDTVAREIMTPRMALEAMPVDTTISELVELIKKSGYSRIPIYEGTDDHILGFVHAKDLLGLRGDGDRPINLRTLTRPVVRVHETADLHTVLRELKQGRGQIAVVQDELGGTSGIVTIEDIIEELIGDIRDEYDNEREPIESKGQGYSVDGRTNLFDLNAKLGSHFESEEFDTIGGYLFGQIGREPTAGEEIVLDDWCFRVEETDGRRIARLSVTPASSARVDQASL